MNATMMGLGVAVPCMILFSFYINKSNQLVGELDAAGMMIHDAILVGSLNVETSESETRGVA